MSDRYIKLSEKILKWEWYTDVNTLSLFLTCLLSANWSDVQYKGGIVPRGSFVTTLPKLSRMTGLTISQIRTSTEKLKMTGEITVNVTNKERLITVINWDKYQKSQGKVADKIADKSADKSQTNRRQYIEIEEIEEKKEVTTNVVTKKEEYENCSPEFSRALHDFEEMRTKIRKPLTDRAKQMILNKLYELAPDEETQIKILDQSTMNSWQGVFELKKKKPSIMDTLRNEPIGGGDSFGFPMYDSSSNPEYDEDRFNELMERRRS